VHAALRVEGAQQHEQEAGEREHDAQRRGDAQRLEGAVADAQPDEVAVRAVLEQLVAVVCDGLQVLRGGRVLQGAQGGGAHGGRDVELLGRAGEEEERRDVREFLLRREAGGGDGGGGAGAQAAGVGDGAHEGAEGLGRLGGG